MRHRGWRRQRQQGQGSARAVGTGQGRHMLALCLAQPTAWLSQPGGLRAARGSATLLQSHLHLLITSALGPASTCGPVDTSHCPSPWCEALPGTPPAQTMESVRQAGCLSSAHPPQQRRRQPNAALRLPRATRSCCFLALSTSE